eukprot:11979676-Alexandrium_andersonii.AAC.1
MRVQLAVPAPSHAGLSNDEHDPDFENWESHFMDRLRAALRLHRMPLVALGSGKTSLRDKFAAIAHT